MDELQAVIDADPFGDAVDNPTRYFVVFLDREPRRWTALEGEDFAPDQFKASGTEIYAWCPEGMQNSRADEGSRQAGPRRGTATVRNWATVNKLLD